MNKSVKTIYRKIAEKYEETYSNKEYPTDKYVKTFVSMMPKRAKILDAGCGTASYTDMFLSKGFAVKGIDISKDMLKIAKDKFPKAKFEVKDLRKMKLKKDTFNGILCMQGITHISKKHHIRILKDFYNGLKPNGILLLTIQEGRGERFAYWPLADTKVFVSYYGLKEIKDRLNDIGFDIILTDRYYPKKGDYQNNKLAIMARKH